MARKKGVKESGDFSLLLRKLNVTLIFLTRTFRFEFTYIVSAPKYHHKKTATMNSYFNHFFYNS